LATLGNHANSRYYWDSKHPICTDAVHIPPLTHQNRDNMINNQTINRLSAKINELLPPEFDIQARVLARTREKLEIIEARLKELEKTLD